MDREDMEEVLQALRDGMSSPFLRDPDIFLSYARAAVLCMRAK
jgi:hypothetical protein